MLLSKEKWRKIVAYKLLFAIYILMHGKHSHTHTQTLPLKYLRFWSWIFYQLFLLFFFRWKAFRMERDAHRCWKWYTKVNKWMSVQAKRLKPLNSWQSERERMCNNCRIKYAIAHKIHSCVCMVDTLHLLYFEIPVWVCKKCVWAWKESEMAVLLVKYLK